MPVGDYRCLPGAAFAQLQDKAIEIVCPCRIESTEAGATVTLGVRSYRAMESGELAVEIQPLLLIEMGNFAWLPDEFVRFRC